MPVNNGKWSNGGISLLWASSSAVFGSPLSFMKLWTNPYVLVSGWANSDIGVLAGTLALASRPGAWLAPSFVSTGIYLRTTASAWSFGFSGSLTPTTVYGWCLGSSATDVPQLYAEMFADGPRIVDASSILTVLPQLYVRNNDVIVP